MIFYFCSHDLVCNNTKAGWYQFERSFNEQSRSWRNIMNMAETLNLASQEETNPNLVALRVKTRRKLMKHLAETTRRFLVSSALCLKTLVGVLFAIIRFLKYFTHATVWYNWESYIISHLWRVFQSQCNYLLSLLFLYTTITRIYTDKQVVLASVVDYPINLLQFYELHLLVY